MQLTSSVRIRVVVRDNGNAAKEHTQSCPRRLMFIVPEDAIIVADVANALSNCFGLGNMQPLHLLLDGFVVPHHLNVKFFRDNDLIEVSSGRMGCPSRHQSLMECPKRSIAKRSADEFQSASTLFCGEDRGSCCLSRGESKKPMPEHPIFDIPNNPNLLPVRLFLAVDLAEAARSSLQEMQSRFTMPPRREIRCTAIPAANLFITLKYFGDTPHSMIPALSRCIRSVMEQQQQFSVQLSVDAAALNAFPNQRKARVLWCAVNDTTNSLEKLHTSLETRLTALKLGNPFSQNMHGQTPTERRKQRAPFQPHVTLFRCQRPWTVSQDRLQLQTASGPPAIVMVDCIHLFQSTLAPSGASYSRIDKFPVHS